MSLPLGLITCIVWSNRKTRIEVTLNGVLSSAEVIKTSLLVERVPESSAGIIEVLELLIHLVYSSSSSLSSSLYGLVAGGVGGIFETSDFGSSASGSKGLKSSLSVREEPALGDVERRSTRFFGRMPSLAKSSACPYSGMRDAHPHQSSPSSAYPSFPDLGSACRFPRCEVLMSQRQVEEEAKGHLNC
jgi:hypothetical protein